MFDFSFLDDGALIPINDESELEELMNAFECAGMHWANGDNALEGVRKITQEIRYIRIRPKEQGFGRRNVITFSDTKFQAYTVSEVLSRARGNKPHKVSVKRIKNHNIKSRKTIRRKYMEVTFLIKKTGEVVTKPFTSYYLGEKFVNKLRHSKKLRLIAFRKI